MHPLMSERIPHDDMLPFTQNVITPSSCFSAPFHPQQDPFPLLSSRTQPRNQLHSQSHSQSQSHSSPSHPISPSQPVLNVVITGGSSGIGAAIVHTFAKAGHRVLFTYHSGRHRAEKLNAIYPKNTTYAPLDQADVSSVANLSQIISKWAGTHGVDILVNNAALGSATVDRYVEQSATTASSTTTMRGQQRQKQQQQQQHSENNAQESFSHSTLKMLERAAHAEALLKVNSLGPMYVTEALEDQLHKVAYKTSDSRAVIIFIGSVGGGSSAVFPEYCAADLMSKAAMTYLSKHIAAKYVQEPIDVMCISPGATETEMFKESTLSKVSDPERFINSMPKRKLIQPDDIAATVFWLSTQSPRGIFHGANLDASMGLAVRPGLQTETANSR